MSHGITTLILVLDPGSVGLWEMAVRQSSAPSIRSETLGEEGAPTTALSEFILMHPEAAAELLAGTGLDPLTGTGSYTPGPMDGVELTFDLRHTTEPGFTSPNVVGLLPGSDPALKDEYIVVTAHLDHVGIRNGQVYNGADDNASGSAAVMEAAEAVAMAGVRRSMIFVLLTAEEKGLLGAFHLAQNPPVPVESIVLNINLDMVGRNSPEFPDALLALASEEGRDDLVGLIREVNETRVGATLDWRLIEGEDPHGHVQRSDQLAFMQQGIPAILITRGFMGPDYHEPSDDPETINYEKVLQAAQLTFGLAVTAANRDERPGRGMGG
jgi:Zn-dependent M28 family amino/carboxypeptidase